MQTGVDPRIQEPSSSASNNKETPVGWEDFDEGGWAEAAAKQMKKVPGSKQGMGGGGREVNPQGWEDGVVSCAHTRVLLLPHYPCQAASSTQA
jgi:hypothetical protein